MKTRSLIRHPDTLQVNVPYAQTAVDGKGDIATAIASIHHTVDRGEEGWRKALKGLAPIDGRVLWTLGKDSANLYMKTAIPDIAMV